jgi:hypothetical protein
MLTGPGAFAFNRALIALLIPHNAKLLRDEFADRLTESEVDDLAVFLTGGSAALINSWIVEAPHPLDPVGFGERLRAVARNAGMLRSGAERKDPR